MSTTLFRGKVIPLKCRVYGIAQRLDLTGNLTLRLANTGLFPFVAAHAQAPRLKLRNDLGRLRAKFLAVVGFGFAVFVASADLVIKTLYDQRYQSAGWILPLLVMGSWFLLLPTSTRLIVLGLGKPSYVRSIEGEMAVLAIGLPIATGHFELLGGVVAVVALVDLAGYIPILIAKGGKAFL